ncbi:hypothetical protein MMC22_005710 [Lobaria immixta]|nr:hypothetical protein [Lobaria immixta]
MALNTKSTSAIVDNVTADTGFSIVDTGSSVTVTPPTNMVTLIQAKYNAMQARIAEAQLILHTSESATQSASGPAPAAFVSRKDSSPKDRINSIPATIPITTSSSHFLCHFEYRGKEPKPDKYYGGSCGKYNTFIKQCKSNFILEGNNSDAG